MKATAGACQLARVSWRVTVNRKRKAVEAREAVSVYCDETLTVSLFRSSALASLSAQIADTIALHAAHSFHVNTLTSHRTGSVVARGVGVGIAISAYSSDDTCATRPTTPQRCCH